MKRRLLPILDSYVFYFNVREDAAAFLTRKGDKDDVAQVSSCRGCCYTLETAAGNRYRMMCVFDGTYATTIHEAEHMAQMLCQHNALKVTSNDNEMCANLTSWLACDFAKAYGMVPEWIKPDKPKGPVLQEIA